MEDVITEAPPPSRFLEEDLNTFTAPSPPPLPPPSLSFSQAPPQDPLTPTLLIIALSPPSLSLFHPSTPPLASLSLPHPFPSPTLSLLTPHTLLLSFPFPSPSPLPPPLPHSIAKLLFHRIRPQSVLIFDSLSPRNHRGRLPSDQAAAFKLETAAERRRADGEKLLEGLEFYPSGSLVDGLGAAVLARCQVLNLRASLCVSWPEFDPSVVSLIKGLLQNGALRGFDLKLGGEGSGDVLRAWRRRKDRVSHSELYT